MVLALIIFISLIALWFLISPTFEKLGKFIRIRFNNFFNDDEGDNKDE